MRTAATHLALVFIVTVNANAQTVGNWPIHALDRPQPRVVDPGPPAPPAAVPSDAIVLFGGKDLAGWSKRGGGPAGWKIEQGYMEVVRGAGDIETTQRFGDVQLHVEWASPVNVSAEGQERGNSGVYLMSTYEVQVLDSYRNVTYADGQASAIYGQYPPLVNASRAPGVWQSYDIIFRRPRFDAAGNLVSPARVTVLHNGLLVQNNVELTGPTGHHARPPYKAHADRLPIHLQDHGDPVRYRNIWVRDLEK
jgi:hypothetical protein